MDRYRSFGAQARHYLERPHEAVPAEPIDSPAAWRGAALRGRPEDWLEHLRAAEIRELEAATDACDGRSLEQIDRAGFPLPNLAERIRDWSGTLARGRGFVVVRGLPVERWGPERSARAYWGIGHHLGIPGAQNPANELLGHVVDYGEESADPLVRRYRTAGNIDFHCDAADVVGLLCLQPAEVGGQSRIASSVAVFNELVAGDPTLAHRLFEPLALDARGEERPGARPWTPVPPARFSADRGLSTFWHSEYFRSAERHEDVQYDAQAHALLDRYDALCADPHMHLDMWLEPGDMQFISNHTTVHARTAYEDTPARRRHLLRLWLSLES
jgi:hypothetical protein